jgi:hypothetical protein
MAGERGKNHISQGISHCEQNNHMREAACVLLAVIFGHIPWPNSPQCAIIEPGKINLSQKH